MTDEEEAGLRLVHLSSMSLSHRCHESLPLSYHTHTLYSVLAMEEDVSLPALGSYARRLGRAETGDLPCRYPDLPHPGNVLNIIPFTPVIDGFISIL